MPCRAWFRPAPSRFPSCSGFQQTVDGRRRKFVQAFALYWSGAAALSASTGAWGRKTANSKTLYSATNPPSTALLSARCAPPRVFCPYRAGPVVRWKENRRQSPCVDWTGLLAAKPLIPPDSTQTVELTPQRRNKQQKTPALYRGVLRASQPGMALSVVVRLPPSQLEPD
jgi:hypothetical protein